MPQAEGELRARAKQPLVVLDGRLLVEARVLGHSPLVHGILLGRGHDRLVEVGVDLERLGRASDAHNLAVTADLRRLEHDSIVVLDVIALLAERVARHDTEGTDADVLLRIVEVNHVVGHHLEKTALALVIRLLGGVGTLEGHKLARLDMAELAVLAVHQRLLKAVELLRTVLVEVLDLLGVLGELLFASLRHLEQGVLQVNSYDLTRAVASLAKSDGVIHDLGSADDNFHDASQHASLGL
mmetsp:Transcript_100812/g.289224  ORF Transcript_100812/g.289224 Transcript_100812/m.289224 type:complete len:241 (-) Transcript_100812:283-1005(-)